MNQEQLIRYWAHLCESEDGLYGKDPGINDELGHLIERTSLPGVSYLHRVSLNRKPLVTEGNNDSITYSAQDIKHSIQIWKNRDLEAAKRKISKDIGSSLKGIAEVFKMGYKGHTHYVVIETERGKIGLRLGDHKAFGRNFDDLMPECVECASVYIDPPTVKNIQHPYHEKVYDQIHITNATYQKNPYAVVDALADSVLSWIENGILTIDPGIGELQHFPVKTTTQNTSNNSKK